MEIRKDQKGTKSQILIDFVLGNGRGFKRDTDCFPVRSCFPDYGNLDKVSVIFLFTGNKKKVLDLIRTLPTIKILVRRDHVKVSFHNNDIATNARELASENGIQFRNPQKNQFDDVKFADIKEGVIFRINSDDMKGFYARKDDRIFILYRQKGFQDGFGQNYYTLLTCDLNGNEISNSTPKGKGLNGRYLSDYKLAKRHLEGLIGITRRPIKEKPSITPRNFGSISEIIASVA